MSSSRLRSLTVRVLAIFVASICTTLLAPVMASPADALVCSAQGTRRVADPASLPAERHADPLAHCPSCMPAGLPPMRVACDFAAVQPLAHVAGVAPATPLAGLVGASLPARGPPTAS